MIILRNILVVLLAHWLMGVYEEAYKEHYGKKMPRADEQLLEEELKACGEGIC